MADNSYKKGGLIMKIIVEIEDGLVGYHFEKDNNVVRFENLSRVEQIRILNSFAGGYELFIKALEEG